MVAAMLSGDRRFEFIGDLGFAEPMGDRKVVEIAVKAAGRSL